VVIWSRVSPATPINDIVVHQTEIIEPEHRRFSVSAQAVRRGGDVAAIDGGRFRR
jgi:hypothetical protein